MPNSQNSFERRLEEARRAANLAKQDLAEACRVALSTVTRWYAGAMPHGSTLKTLSDILGVNAQWLRDGTGPRLLDADQKALADSRLAGNTGTRVMEQPSYGRARNHEDTAAYRVRGELQLHELKPEELHAWRELQLLLQEIQHRLIEAVTDRREEAASRLKKRLDEYLEACAVIRPQAAQFMKEELKRETHSQ
jgi:transcriptional regulator with XRE-family HTH domain